MPDNTDRVTSMTQQEKPDNRTPEELKREVRTLNWKLKTANKQSGAQGKKIYELRNEVTSLRLLQQLTPGDYRRLLDQNRDQAREIAQLQEKLAAKDAQSA